MMQLKRRLKRLDHHKIYYNIQPKPKPKPRPKPKPNLNLNLCGGGFLHYFLVSKINTAGILVGNVIKFFIC